MTRRLHLNAFLMDNGHHEAAWRLPESDPRAGTDVAHWQRLARIAERGRLDSLFLADSPVLWGSVGRRPSSALEPTLLLTALAGVTSHIGLIATASTTYNEPYNLARRFASLDHISGGRAGWNIVTTAGLDAARNFNLAQLPAHRERYERAAEFVEVSLRLWDSWDDGAVLADKGRGVWGDDALLYPAAHDGQHFQVAGALNVSRSPQGRPLLVQAGSSEHGKAFAARYAEAVFTAQQTLDDAQAFYADLKSRAAALGRDPDSVKILPGIVPAIGSTQREALALEEELEQLIRPEYAKQQLADVLRLSPDDLHLDRELPPDLPDEDAIEGAKSRYTLVVTLARRERLTVRELIGRLGGGRGHRTFAGTPEQVADAIQQWFDSGAADGFNIMPPVLPRGLVDFVDHVVPILQRRGLFRTEYEGTTLRDNYGLARPANRNAQRVPA
jgi:FMN-dependent oxidoreductase (nitrilotriacetate monooxygenase family)